MFQNMNLSGGEGGGAIFSESLTPLDVKAPPHTPDITTNALHILCPGVFGGVHPPPGQTGCLHKNV